VEDFADEILSEPLSVDDSLTGQSIRQRRALIFNNAFTEPVGHQIPGTPEDLDERLIVAPFIVDNEVLGAMCLNRIGQIFTAEELALVETFAAYASTALKNAKDQHCPAGMKSRNVSRPSRLRLRAKNATAISFENNQTVAILLDPQSSRIIDANPAACQFRLFAPNIDLSLYSTRIP
jgi:transcriptional regulator with GAF, ATPase, and Fis domain